MLQYQVGWVPQPEALATTLSLYHYVKTAVLDQNFSRQRTGKCRRNFPCPHGNKWAVRHRFHRRTTRLYSTLIVERTKDNIALNISSLDVLPSTNEELEKRKSGADIWPNPMRSKVALTYECDRIETNDKFGCVARCSACGWTDINVSGALNFSKQETSFKVKLSVKN
jgi:hypothetical protein